MVKGITAIVNHEFNSNWNLTATTAYRDFDRNIALTLMVLAAPALVLEK
jgi:hypothetical protein